MIATHVLSPADRDEAAAIVASPTHDHFWLTGAGTLRDSIPSPADGAAPLSTARLDRVIEYEPADLTVTVEAGCPVARLQEILGHSGQFLPVDYPPTGTVGGLIASGAFGPRALGYGAVRERLLGLTAITAAGKVTRSGSRVVKSVAGFDLHRLYCGSFGTLVLIVEATFKLAPLPARREAIHLAGSRADIAHLAQRLLGSRLRPSALVAGSRAEANWLQVDVEGSPARVARLTAEIRQLAASIHLREDQPAQENSAGPADASQVILHLDLAAAREFFVRHSLPGAVIADLGTGRVIIEHDEPPSNEEIASLERWLRPGNSLSYMGGAGPTIRRHLDPVAAALTRRLKKEFDPDDRFNRGLLEKLI